MHLLLIGCEILQRELCDAAARSPHRIDLRILPTSLHDAGARSMRQRIQDEIDRAEGGPYDALVLGYALCGNGLAAIEARSIPLVLARAHDCITLLMGSRAAYAEAFRANPGVFYRSVGWVERGAEAAPLLRDRNGESITRASLIERHGAEDGQYLYEELIRYQHRYTQLTYIQSDIEPGTHHQRAARAEAKAKGWTFATRRGNLVLIRKLLAGEWGGGDFLIVPAGHRIVPTHDDRVISAEQA